MKNENAKKIIAIVIVLLVLAIVGVLVLSMTGGIGMDESGLFSSGKKTKYINEKATSDDKIAIVFDYQKDEKVKRRGMVVTMDRPGIVSAFEKAITETAEGGYSEIELLFDEEINTEGSYGINLSDYKESAKVKIILEDENWFLTKEKIRYQGEVYDMYDIYCKFDLGNNEVFRVGNRIAPNSDEEVVKQLFREMKNNIKMYYVDETSNDYTIVLDVNNNKVDLSEYPFVKDIVAKVLAKKEELVLKDSKDVIYALKDTITVDIDIEGNNEQYKRYVIYPNSDKTLNNPEVTFKFKGNNAKGVINTYGSTFLIENNDRYTYIKGSIQGNSDFFIESDKIMTKDEFVKDFE